jgi:hypothetical protein
VHQVISSLSERDRLIVRLLDRHRVLTTHQVAEAAFPSIRRTETRMGQLHAMRVVDRFRPFRATGSAPYHWVLDHMGACIAAWERGVDVGQLGWRRERAVDVAASGTLPHLLGVNSFFTALMRAARQRPGCELGEWLSAADAEAEFRRRYRQGYRPDGSGEWTEAGVWLPFWLEYVVPSARKAQPLRDRLAAYERAARHESATRLVLIAFEDRARESEERRGLETWLPAATAVILPHPTQSPADALWLPLRPGADQRRRLIELSAPQVWRRQAAVAEDRPDCESAAGGGRERYRGSAGDDVLWGAGTTPPADDLHDRWDDPWR